MVPPLSRLRPVFVYKDGDVPWLYIIPVGVRNEGPCEGFAAGRVAGSRCGIVLAFPA